MRAVAESAETVAAALRSAGATAVTVSASAHEERVVDNVRVPDLAGRARWSDAQWLELLEWSGALQSGALDALRPASSDGDDHDDDVLPAYRLPCEIDAHAECRRVHVQSLSDTLFDTAHLHCALDVLARTAASTHFAVLVLRCEPTAMDEQDRAVLVYVDPEQASDSDTRVRFVCVGKNAECEI